jgi:hypothetical protein
MAAPFIRTNGTTPQVDFGTPLGGVISLTAVDTTANETITLPPESCGLMGVIFQQLDDKVVANTVDETSQFGTGGTDDTRTITADMASAGQCYFIRLNGYISNTGTPTGTLRIKLGSTNLVVTGPTTLPSGLTNAFVETVFHLTVRSTGALGTVIGQGHTKLIVGALGTTYNRQLTMTAPATIDFTVDQAIDVTYQWGTADPANSLTITNSMIQVAR